MMTASPLHTVYFPDGRPCPPLLTQDEAIKLLRLDTVEISDREGTLRRYRESGLLRGTQISKRIFYKLDEVLRFMEVQTEAVQR